MTFKPVASLSSALRDKLLVDDDDAWGGAAPGLLHLPAAAGNCLDIELTVTFPGGVVPVEFGTVGVVVLGAQPAATAHEPLWTAVAASTPEFSSDKSARGPDVVVTTSLAGSIASWGAVTAGPGTSCNEVGLIDTGAGTSFTLRLGAIGHWIDVGWCAANLDGTGVSWTGPGERRAVSDTSFRGLVLCLRLRLRLRLRLVVLFLA